MRNTRMLMIASLLLAPAAHAAPACEDAAGVARAFFEATSGDDGRVLDAPPALVSPAFAKALREERACQVREEGICTIDSDPWLDGQDGEIDSAVRYGWKPVSATAGEVTLSYSVWKSAHLTRLPMVRHGKGCWQVDDVITNGGQSVRKILAQPVP
ncbi:hypothetical protein [Stenotrophomonas sp.]|uniref:hypothetical protein n=1 Tax=Stenotrophomonas sp. TaxID=69392 RepID=UPI0028983B2F|nr:hypothetical protein [Stenotrophomonas sp.]